MPFTNLESRPLVESVIRRHEMVDIGGESPLRLSFLCLAVLMLVSSSHLGRSSRLLMPSTFACTSFRHFLSPELKAHARTALAPSPSSSPHKSVPSQSCPTSRWLYPCFFTAGIVVSHCCEQAAFPPRHPFHPNLASGYGWLRFLKLQPKCGSTCARCAVTEGHKHRNDNRGVHIRQWRCGEQCPSVICTTPLLTT
jgi:hypothetical protein